MFGIREHVFRRGELKRLRVKDMDRLAVMVKLKDERDLLVRANSSLADKAINSKKELEIARADLERYLALGEVPEDVPELWAEIETGGTFRVWSTLFFTDRTAYNHTTQRMFVTPQGQVGQGKNAGMVWSDTNVKEGGLLPGGIPAALTTVCVELIGMDNETAARARAEGALAFDLIQTRLDLTSLGAMLWGESGRVGWLSLARFKGKPKKATSPHGVWTIDKDGVHVPKNGGALFSLLTGFGDGAGVLTGRMRVTFTGVWQEPVEIG